MQSHFSSEICSISARVDRLTVSADGTPEPKRKKAAETGPHSSRLWADRRDSGLSNPLPHFRDSDAESDEEMEGTLGTLSLSESSEALVKGAFSSTLTNSERRKIRAHYVHSGLHQTRCPKLDPVFKTASGKAEAKSGDIELARLQAFVLDPVGPLLHLLEKLKSEDAALSV